MDRAKKNDKILIIGVLLIACIAGVILLFTQKTVSDGGVAVVTIDGAEYAQFSLDENVVEKIELPDGSYNILEIKDGKADITEASCPDGICVNHRKISKTNQTIVCLPNKVIITIQNGAEDDVDMMTN